MSEIARRDYPIRYVLGTPLQVTSYAELSQRCQALTKEPGPVAIEFANTQVITMRRHQASFRTRTQIFDYFVPDGMPLLWCMNWCGAGLQDRVYGPVFMRVLMRDTPAPFTHYLLGGSPEASEPLLKAIHEWNIDTQVVGKHHGFCNPDGELQDTAVIEEINRLSPDFIL